MSLQYIIGITGSGKTEYCITEALKRDNEGKKSIFITPEQATFITADKFMGRQKGHTLLHTDVTSFTSLAKKVIRKEGCSKDKILGDVGKAMLVRKIIYNAHRKNKLEFYSSSYNKKGFCDKIGKAFTELLNYSIDPNTLLEAAQSTEKSVLIKKYNDIVYLYNEYTDFLKKEFISTDGILDVFCDIIKTSDYLKDTQVWIDGFISFTPQEISAISSMVKYAEMVYITVNLQGKDLTVKNNFDPYLDIKNSANKILKNTVNEGIDVKKIIYLEENIRHKDTPELTHLTENYLNVNLTPYKKETDAILLVAAEELYGEIEFTCRQIRKLIIEKGYSYDDIAVITSGSDYNAPLTVLMDRYNIPYFLDERESITSYSLSVFIMSIAEIFAFPFSGEAISSLLKTGYIKFKTKEREKKIWELDYFIKATGLGSYKLLNDFKMDENTYYRFDANNINYALTCVRRTLEPLIELFKTGRKHKVKHICSKLFEVLEYCRIPKEMEKANQNTQSEEERQFLGQIWDIITEIFEKLCEIEGETIADAGEFYAMLKAGFDSSTVGKIPSKYNRVTVGDLSRTRTGSLKALFILGLNEGNIPPKVSFDSVIEDKDRLAFANKLELAGDTSKYIIQNNYALFRMMTLPSEKLYLTYCEKNEKGEKNIVSSTVYTLKDIFKNLTELSYNDDINSVEDITSLLPLYDKLTENIAQNNKLNEFYEGIYSYVLENTNKRGIIWENAIRNTEYKLAKQIADEIFKDGYTTSVSQLESYAKCPFYFYTKYILKLKDRPNISLTSIDIGNIMHYTLEELSKNIKENFNNDWGKLIQDNVNIDELVGKCADNIKKDLKKNISFSSANGNVIFERIKNTLSESVYALSNQASFGNFKPLGYEMSFGEDKESDMRTISLVLDSKTFKLTGKIDKLEVYKCVNDDTDYIKITDFKSSAKNFSPTSLYYGSQLQMPLYMDAILENKEDIGYNSEDKLMPGCIFYFDLSRKVQEEDSENEEERIKSYKQTGLILENENIIKALDEDTQYSKDNKIKLSSNRAIKAPQKADEEQFFKLLDYAKKKAKNIAQSISSGEIKADPYKDKNGTACSPSNLSNNFDCPYKSICKKEASDQKGRYNIYREILLKDTQNKEAEWDKFDDEQ